MKYFIMTLSVIVSLFIMIPMSAIISVIINNDQVGVLLSAIILIIINIKIYKKINKQKQNIDRTVSNNKLKGVATPLQETIVSDKANLEFDSKKAISEEENEIIHSKMNEIKEDIIKSVIESSSIEMKYNGKNTNNVKKGIASSSYHKANFIPKSYVVFDFETTGFDPNQNEIIQIGAIRYHNHEQIDTFESLVNPRTEISSKITKITGITNSDVKDAPYIEDILPAFLDFIGNDVLVAHNASFDMKFLITNIQKCSLSFQDNLVIDTLSLARKYIKETENHKLETLKKYLSMDEILHQALADCKVCAAVFKQCLDIREASLKLDEKESRCLQIVTKILEENNRDINLIRYLHVGNYFDISAFTTIARFKLKGKKQYLITHKPLEKIQHKYPQANCGPTTKGETGQTRIYFEDIEEISKYKDLYIRGYDKAIEDQNYYVENVSKGAKVLEGYYSL